MTELQDQFREWCDEEGKDFAQAQRTVWGQVFLLWVRVEQARSLVRAMLTLLRNPAGVEYDADLERRMMVFVGEDPDSSDRPLYDDETGD